MQISNSITENYISIIFDIIFRLKFALLALLLVFCLSGVAYSFYIAEKYESRASLAPVDFSSGMSLSGLGGLSDIASFAGVNLSDTSPNTQKYIQIFTSAQFLHKFFEKRNLVPHVMAVVDWDENSGELQFDEEVYSFEKQSWTRNVRVPFNAKPTELELVEKVLEDFLFVYIDEETSFITIKVMHYSPYVARDWLNDLISEINYYIKEIEKKEARKTIEFLDKLLEETSINDARQSLFNIKEEQLKRLMNAELTEEFAFNVLQAPSLNLDKKFPNRPLILIFSFIMGLFFAGTIVLIYFSLNLIRTEH